MIRSMTAYAALDVNTDAGQVGWELRSVNQRYLDLSLRLPEDFRPLEPAIRERLRDRLGRGKVEVNLRFRPDPVAMGERLSLNRPLAEALIRRYGELADLAGMDAQPDLEAILRWPNVVVEESLDMDTAREQALVALDQAVDALIEGREREGEAMARLIRTRLEELEGWIARIREWMPAIRTGLKERFQARIEGFEQPLDPGRMEQELALQLQKLDVDEELDRLETHAAEVRRILGTDKPLGRRLDFLMQELNREANTLGSKATDPRTAQAAVELKVLIEQMREQVQNVE